MVDNLALIPNEEKKAGLSLINRLFLFLFLTINNKSNVALL